ncbi:hypothetical protein JCM6882_007844 [Rhodosporidiobolus microsporus]
MDPPSRRYRVAAAQIEAVYYDAQANLELIKNAIGEAAAGGARLVVFSELALSGYPFHIWALPYHEQLPYIQSFYSGAAVEADGPEAQALAACCKLHGIRAVVGFSEREGGSLFMSQWIISPEGELVVRRKLKPTSLERILYGEGDGSDIRVHETELGRLGALQCWEHAQCLIKYAMSSQHEEIHCASWPVFPAELPHQSLSVAGNSALLTAYAIETGTFVVSASSFFTEQNLKKLFGDKPPALSLGGGYTCILGPEGETLARAPPDQSSIIYSEVDLDLCYRAKSILDPLGHYSRTDVFQVHIDTAPRQTVHIGPHPPSLFSSGGGFRQPHKLLYGGSTRQSRAASEPKEAEKQTIVGEA